MPAKKPAAKKAAAKKKVEEAEDKREVATQVDLPAVDLVQNKLIESREYGEAVRKDSIARNREKRNLAQKAQTLTHTG